MSAPSNPLPLLSVKTELDSSLAIISRDLEDFFSDNSNLQALEKARDELHRVKGVLQMLLMHGLVVFCAELETLLQDLSAHPQDASAMRQDALHRALFGITHYLDAMAAGAPNATLRLFQEYQELHQARGVEMAFEADLFFPDLQVELPASLLNEEVLADSRTHIRNSRMLYQQNLLKWLRKEDAIEALRGMMSAVRVVLSCAPQNNQRAFWWVSGGLLNCVLHDGVPPELNVKKALSRIDQRMRALLENSGFDEDAALCEMLYLVARSHTVSKTVESIKQTFDLDTYLPETPPLPPSETAALLHKMRAQLTVADETWERCVAEDSAARAQFTEQAEQLYLLSEQLDRNTLQFLCKQIRTIAAHSGDNEYVQRISVDMAMALLLLNSGIDHYQHLGSGFHEQTRILSMRLQAGMMRMPEDVSKLDNLVSLFCEMEQREVMSPLATEMQNNLQNIEQGLNAFFGDAAKRTELLQVNRLMSQVQGGLHILSLDLAEQLLSLLGQFTSHYQQGLTPSTSEMRSVASAVSILEDYVHGLTLGQKPDPTTLNSTLHELSEMRSHSGQDSVSIQEEIPSVGVSIRSGNEDTELLEVFLEEAQEVMETLRSNLEISRLHVESREPLVTIRRAFHTLKGSGRMVGLTELGEVAWSVERAMNSWLAKNVPATPELLEMVGDAEVLFQHWVDMLKSGSTSAHIDTSHLLTVADCIETGKPFPQPAIPEIAVEAVENLISEVPPEEAQIQIGSVVISPMLFRIASEEAAERVAALQTLFGDLQKDAARVVTYDFMRAAHTLAGVNRTMGFTEIAELSFALEQWLQARIDKPGIVSDAQIAMLSDVILHLDEMCAAIRNLLMPQAQTTLNERLMADKLLAPTVEIQIADSKPVPSPAQTALVAKTSAPAEEAQVQVGSVTISPLLFRIASQEVAERLAALKTHLADMQNDVSHVVVYDFMRAAHSLAGVNRTMGFISIAELSHALEMWLEPRIDKQAIIDDAQLALLSEVINQLESMCSAVKNLQEPQPNSALNDRLIADQLPVVSNETPLMLAKWGSQAMLEQLAIAELGTDENPTPDSRQLVQSTQAELIRPVAAPVIEPLSVELLQPTRQERKVHDDVDEQLLPIFLEEANELYPQIGNTMRAWREQPRNPQIGHNLQRSLHTLKGSARMAGAMRLGELTHRVEDRVGQAISSAQFDDALWNEMDGYLDRIALAIEQLHQPLAVPATESALAQTAATTPVNAPVVAQTLEIGAERAMQAALLRVRSDTVDRLVNEAGEVSVARSRAELELRNFKNSVLELTESVNRLRRQVRDIEIHAEGQMQARVSITGDSADKFDPLEFDRFTRFQELTRFMNESVHDVQTVQQTLLINLAEAEAALSAQAQLNRDLQQGLMNIRMVPFSSISERLYRIVRQTGKELGKRAHLELSGSEIELDRSVLEKMTAPFEHLLRNAIAHGLESPEQREKAGKSPNGEIRLSLRQESNEVVFELSDDGVGLDIQRIRQKALDSGAISTDEEVSDEQVMQLIFNAGLSTAQEVTEISGRGVGLDVVRSEISALGGRVDVTSEFGHGVHFVIHLPLTLAVTKTLMVKSGQTVFALPSTMVEHMQQIKASEVEAVYRQRYLDWQGHRYSLHYLPRLVGDELSEVLSQPYNPVLFLRSGEHRIALHVDGLLGNQEVVVKNIGPQLARLPGIAGATVSGSGKVILIINPVAFTQRIPTVRHPAKVAQVAEVMSAPLVMVVDDSLTVRKITSRLLERAGYQVVTAKDGVDALEQLADISPSIMLLDVEMPRMDGFELTKRLRQDSKTRSLPIIMITSRTAEKHRNYALEMGVNEYLGKPFQDDILLGHIARYIKSAQVRRP